MRDLDIRRRLGLLEDLAQMAVSEVRRRQTLLDEVARDLAEARARVTDLEREVATMWRALIQHRLICCDCGQQTDYQTAVCSRCVKPAAPANHSATKGLSYSL